MADGGNENDENVLPWYDYQPGVPVPNHVTHLRIGVQEAVAAAEISSAPEIMELPEEFCSGHPNLQQVQIHVQSIRYIKRSSFFECQNLEQVEFVATAGQSSDEAAAATTTTAATGNAPVQSGLRGIDDWAFAYSSKLHSVIGLEHVSCSLARIGENAFWYCENLAFFDFSCLARLRAMKVWAFAHCHSLTVADLSNSLQLQNMGKCIFSCCHALHAIHLPPNLREIQLSAFVECFALVSIVIPASVTRLGIGSFANCSSFTTVTFESTQRLHLLMSLEQFRDTPSLHTLELQGPAIPRELWPRLLEQFFREENGLLARAGICNGKQRITIAWNFVRKNIANFYIDEKKPAHGRKRDILG